MMTDDEIRDYVHKAARKALADLREVRHIDDGTRDRWNVKMCELLDCPECADRAKMEENK